MELHREYRWESARRYYVAMLTIDMLGDYVLCLAAGGLFNRLGKAWTVPVASVEEGLAQLADIAKVRRSRRYQPVPFYSSLLLRDEFGTGLIRFAPRNLALQGGE